ncbi:hypothetical protein AWC07_13525 [Mycobacterium gastri]|uniref:Uncharacterized protein n=1 Tax=Mycobacterium gastri TaxID=1777 RepID=A0A1X1V8J3_MYCGS|nr:hypothetical protein AWC07_13525 [Mycobacterium gastri]
MFVDAAGEGIWSVFADPRLLAQAADAEPEVRSRIQRREPAMAHLVAVSEMLTSAAADLEGIGSVLGEASPQHFSARPSRPPPTPRACLPRRP